MAVTQSALVDLLFKKVITSKSTTQPPGQTIVAKQYFEEAINSRLSTFSTDVWALADQIPSVAAGLTGIVDFVLATMSHIPGTDGAYYDALGVLRDLIPFNYSSNGSYEYDIRKNDDVTAIAKGDPDWVLDPNSGVLTFFNGAASGTITGAAGVIATPGSPPIVRAYKYVGPKGIIPRLAGLTYSGGTLSSNVGLLSAGQGLTLSSALTYSILLATSNSGLTFSTEGGLKALLNIITSDGLTFSDSGTLSVWLKETNSGLTFSNGALGLNTSLVLTDVDATLSTNVLGKYTTDPSSIAGWDFYSIPNKGYVDAIASGLSLKQAVRVAATGSVDLVSAPAQIDGITLSFGDRVLLWKQDETVNGTISNGIYAFSASGQPLTRVTDLDGSPTTEVVPGVYTFVTDGLTHVGTGFVVVNIATESVILVGTNSMKWTQFSGAGTYFWGEGLDATGQTINLDIESDKGLTISNDQLSLVLMSNSGLYQSDTGLSLDPAIAINGLTFSNGRLETYLPITLGRGLTVTGGTGYETFTYSVDLANNSGLTFSDFGQLVLDPYVFASQSGLSFSNGSASLNVSYGITVSAGVVRSSWTFGQGFDIVEELSSTASYTHKLQPRLNSTTGLYFYTGVTPSELSIDWDNILGTGLTWSGSKLNTTSAGVNKYTLTYTFSAGSPHYVTHSLGTSDFVIQMYNNTTGDEVLAQYSTRTNNDVIITAFEDVQARIVIIG